MKNKIIEITNKLNTIIDASNYSVPLLDNFEIIVINSSLVYFSSFCPKTLIEAIVRIIGYFAEILEERK